MSFKSVRDYRQDRNRPIVIRIVSSGGSRGAARGARTPTSFRPNFFGDRPKVSRSGSGTGEASLSCRQELT